MRLELLPRIFGLDATLVVPEVIPLGPGALGLRTSAGFGYQTHNLFRDATDAAITIDAIPASSTPIFRNTNTIVELGSQFEVGTVTTHLFLRSRYERYRDIEAKGDSLFLAQAATRPEVPVSLVNSVVAAVVVDTVAPVGPAHLKQGLVVTAGVEYGPAGLGNEVGDAAYELGRADFTRTELKTVGYLVMLAEDPIHLSVNGEVVLDAITGPYAPLAVRTRIGTFDPRNGLADTVRGFTKHRFDGRYRAAVNLEGRLIGPELFGLPLRPGALLYADAGTWSDNADATLIDHIVFSSGAGLTLRLLLGELAVDAILYGNLPAADSANLTVGLGYHF